MGRNGQKRGAEKKGGGAAKKAKKVEPADEGIQEEVDESVNVSPPPPMNPESEVSDEEIDDEEFDDEEEDEEEEEEVEEEKNKKVNVTKTDDEEVDDEEVDDEEFDDEEEDEEDGDNKELQFEFGAWPPDEGDEEGIVNILTQTFLRTDIDLKGAADMIIENSPHGTVIVVSFNKLTPQVLFCFQQGPGPDEKKKEEEEDKDEDEDDGMLYGLCTTMGLNTTAKDDAPKFIKDIFAYLLNRAKKGAPSEFYKKLEEIQSAADGKTALFINDRLLNFSPLIVPKMFSSLQAELEKNMEYKTFIYIQKIRIAENSTGSGSSSGKNDGQPPKKKGKMGKAEKKRAAAAALANADIEFDNVEDAYLFKVTDI